MLAAKLSAPPMPTFAVVTDDILRSRNMSPPNIFSCCFVNKPSHNRSRGTPLPPLPACRPSFPTAPSSPLPSSFIPSPLRSASSYKSPSPSTTKNFVSKKSLIPLPAMPDPYTSPRENTVKTLANMLKAYTVIHVRGTPASGKTTLAHLLRKHLFKQGTPVALIRAWPENTPYEQVLIDGAARSGYTISPLDLDDIEFTFIIDEGQMSYFDRQFWLGFVKLQNDKTSGPRLAFFTSYGSPTQGPTNYPAGSPLAYLAAPQRVSITVSEIDGSPGISLFLDNEEFRDMIQRLSQHESLPVPMTDEAVDFVWDLTRGHPGAVRSVLSAAATIFHTHIKHTKRPVTAKMLQELVRQEERFYHALRFGPVWRSFPPVIPGDQTSKRLTFAASSVLRRALQYGQVLCDLDDESVKNCYHEGYLHAEFDGSQLVLVFPTPLHAAFCERYLTVTELPFPSQQFPTLDDLVIATLRQVPRRMLLHTSPLGIAAVRRLPEACYQDAFRAALHQVLGFRGRVSSEWSGSESGRIDFFIEGPGWGVEIMRDGDRLQNHLERFSVGGAYRGWLDDGRMKDYRILDFRTSTPKACVAPRLWRVVLSEDEKGGLFGNAHVTDSHNVTITDASGNPIIFPLIA